MRVASGPVSRRALLAALALTALLPSAARPAGAVENEGKGTNAALIARIDALLAEPGLKGGFQGLVVQSLRDGSVWYERNADMLFLPASNQKLLTSAAVLNALGPDWTYVTTLQRAGTLDDDGTLHGSLYLKGSGDPLLLPKHLEEFVDSVKAAGIKKVQGRLIGDDSRFDHKVYGFGWEWDDMPFYYSAQVSGLNLNENLVLVSTDPGRKPGDPVRVSVTPTDKYLKVVNRARTLEKGQPSSVTISRDLGQNQITVDGGLPLDPKPTDARTERITVENPTRFATFYLAEKLRAAGIEVTGGEGEGVTPDSGTTEVARHASPPMAEILKLLNKPSDNLVAECLLKTLGAEKGKNGVGSTAAGRDAAMEWFKTIGIDPQGIQIEDGSGLSRHNFVTPRNYAMMLKAMYTHPYSRAFTDSLPIAGVDGSLRNRMKGTPAERTVKAKTGYVSNVSSLSGYATTAGGEPLLFVMLMNNHNARNAVPVAVQDKIAVLLAGWK